MRLHVIVKGLVQGVGFRPYIYALAKDCQLYGWVTNSSIGVIIEVEGNLTNLTAFLKRLPEEAPPLSLIQDIITEEIPDNDENSFTIKESILGKQDTLISPDMAICDDCLRELYDSEDRRYRYPFINCTNCGPRFTIIEDLPYDRKVTTMKEFPLCPECDAEYHAPLNRRFHAQPNACPVCGPQLSFYDNQKNLISGDPLALAQEYLSEGKILAVKGLGGYHLACDATNNTAVKELRRRKYRYDKPFALMMPDIAAVKRYCDINDKEEELLLSPRRPIVILKKNQDAQKLAYDIAPFNHNLGVMLPYTPLHYLLIEGFDALVMTSGNISDEPLSYEDDDALNNLAFIADGFLTHNRAIFRPCDDSVIQVAGGDIVMIRRSRGYAPQPVMLKNSGPSVLALGAEEKNTFCLTKGDKAFLSQHIGDLENIPTYNSFQREIEYFKKMFDIKPQAIAYDMHPEYLSTKYALKYEKDIPRLSVQHHHAHLASVLAEYGRNDKAIGLIFDGTGMGTDGSIWGGEVLIGNQKEYWRAGHLSYAPLPGGAKAIKEPWRMALSYLALTFGIERLESMQVNEILGKDWELLWKGVEKGINAPLTSGMGRLFDAVSVICGIIKKITYHGQAAIQLEQAIDDGAIGNYQMPYKYDDNEGALIIDWCPMFRELIVDLDKDISAGTCALKFHNAILELVVSLSLYLREKEAINTVVLSGGVWQNRYLLDHSIKNLEEQGFEVLTNRLVPANDGGIALGQAAVLLANL